MKAEFDAPDIPVAGSFKDLCNKADIMRDFSPGDYGPAVYGTPAVRGYFPYVE